MIRLWLLKFIAILGCGTLPWNAFAIEASTNQQRLPNIVMIVSDDQGYTDYGFMGHKHIRTPRLDQLSRQSLLFPRGYAVSSVCRPSLVSILTGEYPHQHFITSNDPPPAPTEERRTALRREQIAYIDNAPTLPRLLGEKGYVSFQTGKWWEGNFARGGFTDGMTHGDPAHQGRHGDEGIEIGRQTLEPIKEFLDKTAGKPFFLWYAPMMPHLPHNAPERFKEHYRGKAGSKSKVNYWAMCEWFDETCGQLLDELDERGLMENTVVVYVTDNGWLQDLKSYRNAPKSKLSQYDAGHRTPIMLSWPGRIEPKKVDAPISSIDLAPTILRMVGIEPPVEMTGVNLLDPAAVAARKRVFGETFAHDALDVDRPAACLEYRWCVEWPWRLIVPNGTVVPQGKLELFNLADDPWEEKNLAEAHPETVDRVLGLLDGWWNPAAAP